jgi:PKD repeat protein
MFAVAVPAFAQDEPNATPTPMENLIRNAAPLSVSLIVYPTYGSAPMLVGAFADVVDPLDSPIVSYYWNFGDGNVSTLPNPLLVLNTYKNPGIYMVTLRIVTADGRTAMAFAGVTVSGTPR